MGFRASSRVSGHPLNAKACACDRDPYLPARMRSMFLRDEMNPKIGVIYPEY